MEFTYLNHTPFAKEWLQENNKRLDELSSICKNIHLQIQDVAVWKRIQRDIQ